MYMSLQGKVYLATRNSQGVPGAFRYIGATAAGELSLETDVLEHKEQESGQRLTDHRMVRGKSASLSLPWEDFNIDNLALALYGAKSTVNAGSVSVDEIFPNPVAVGDFVKLNFPRVSSVVLKDSTGSPVTLTDGTHYRVSSPDHGTIEILSLSGLTQPIKADSYNYAQHTNVGMFTQPAPERFLRFEGINTEDSDAKVLIELYRVRFNPLDRLALKSDDIAQMGMTAGVLYDPTRASDAVLGQFGRITYMS